MVGKKILVADDSLTIQKVIRLALSNEGYELRAVSDGHDAAQQISVWKPDVILIDISLPSKNAFEVKREINQHSDLSSIRFILMWSAFEKIDELQAAEVIFHGRLMKPFDPASLRQVLTQALDTVDLPTDTLPPFQKETDSLWDEPAAAPPPPGPALDFPDLDAEIKTLTESTLKITGVDHLDNLDPDKHFFANERGRSSPSTSSLPPIPVQEDTPPEDTHPEESPKDEWSVNEPIKAPSIPVASPMVSDDEPPKIVRHQPQPLLKPGFEFEPPQVPPDSPTPEEGNEPGIELSHFDPPSFGDLPTGGASQSPPPAAPELGLDFPPPAPPSGFKIEPPSETGWGMPPFSPENAETAQAGGNTPVPPPSIQAQQPTAISSTQTSAPLLPPNPSEIESLVHQQVEAILADRVQKLLPEIAERVVKAEIHKLLSE